MTTTTTTADTCPTLEAPPEASAPATTSTSPQPPPPPVPPSEDKLAPPPQVEEDAGDDNRNTRIKRLKAKLVNEEHRLVLMKKIRQSQTRPPAATNATTQLGNSSNSTPISAHGASHLNNNHSNNNINNINNQNGSALSAQMSKKLRPAGHQSQMNPNQQLGASSNLRNSLSSSPMSQQLAAAAAAAAAHAHQSSLNQTPAHAHQRPKVNTLWNPPPQQARHPPPVGIAPPHVGNLSRAPITTPPNVVQAVMSSLAGQQSLLASQVAALQAASGVAGGSPAGSSSGNRRGPQGANLQQSHQNALSKSTAQLLLQQQQQSQQQNKRPSFKPTQTIQKQIEQTLMQQQQQSKLNQSGHLGGFPNLNSQAKRAVGITSPHVGNLSRQPITTPPNVVHDMRGGLAGQQSLLMNSNSSNSSNNNNNNSLSSSSRSRQQQSPAQQSPFNKSQAAQMLIQKRAAAKTAIQKQLEQTLMQLPQKQIQVGIDFIPNANNLEFVYYVGLEACVDYLTDTKNPLDIQPLEKPYECSTCGTDFTPSWSWKRSNAVCENCVSNHVKKSIKNNQANRIKVLLAKSAKHEQEMDQRIMAEAANVVSAPSPVSSSGMNQTPPQQQKHSLLQPASHHQQRSSGASITTSSNSQAWPRVNASPLNAGNNPRTTASSTANVVPNLGINSNLLANLQPAALASLLQNPLLASIMNPQQAAPPAPPQQQPLTSNSSNTNNNNTNNNQLVAALLSMTMNMNMWRR